MRKILAVDDDPNIIELITSYFSARGFEVYATTEGAQVLDLAISKEPDLIILDINLPDIDGLSVLKTLKNRPITAFIPVIILTAKTSADFQVDGLVTGADDYVTKPFDLNVLYARVLNSLRRSLLPTRFKHDQFNLLSYLLREYSKRGYKVYSKLLDNYSPHPPYWRGYIPDMIIEKPEKLRCFNFETTQSIMEESFLDRLNSLVECHKNTTSHFEATVIVRTMDNYKIVQKLVNEHCLPIKIKYFKKHIRRNLSV
jgi:CheY-like chemotaxis protein